MPVDMDSFLATVPLFATLNDPDRRAIASLARDRSYGRGEAVTHYGDVWPYLFVVVEGAVDAVKESSEGRSLFVVTLEAREVFWGLAFFNEGSPMPVMLRAREDSLLSLWSREALLPILSANGGMSLDLCRLMITRMQRASQMVEELAFQPVAGRVARLLLYQFPPEGDYAPRNLTLDEMAARAGTTREMVSRFLHRFANEGLIHITRTEFYVTDRQGLEDLTQQVKG